MPIFIGSSSYGIGIGEAIYAQALRQTPDTAYPLPLDGFTQISRHLRDQHRLNGPDYAFNTACTSSANAILSAAQSLTQKRHPYALVIGVETFNATTLAGFHGMQLLSHEMMRPFDQRRSGLVLGEGCSALLFQLDETDASGISIRAGASQCDTYSISASNPDGSAIADVMRAAMHQARIDPHNIVAIKAHGTASPLNDDGEVAGMRRVFENVPPFFSLKSYIGHTLGGCGAIETALVAAAITSKQIPKSAGFETSDPDLAITPMIEPMSAPEGDYMLNFFGFGGNNCSIILQARC
jgi:3-oxoacyl-[acyl-carrier-protein] synthase-1